MSDADRGAELAAELLRRRLPVRMIARGGSMWPWLRDGAEVLIEPRFPRVGEVAAAIWLGELVLHRVIAVDGAEMVLRGDALDRTERVALKDVLGTVPTGAAAMVPLTRALAKLRRYLFLNLL